VIGIAAIAILSCCSGGCATHATQQGQAALAKGDYDQALAQSNAAAKTATLERCIAMFESRGNQGYRAYGGYCLQAVERGNKLPDEINESLCRSEVGTDDVQYLSTSPFCQNTTPEVRSTIQQQTAMEAKENAEKEAEERKKAEAQQKELDGTADRAICENLPPYIAAAMNSADFYSRLTAGAPENVNIRGTQLTALANMTNDVPGLLSMITQLEQAENVSRRIAIDSLSRRLSWIARLTERGSSDFNLAQWCDELEHSLPDRR
jgi:hypothetical protein